MEKHPQNLGFLRNDRPSYPDSSGRAPWALVTRAEPLKCKSQICQAGSAKTFEGSTTAGNDQKEKSVSILSFRKVHTTVPVSRSRPFPCLKSLCSSLCSSIYFSRFRVFA